jgi:hypothetical protein
LSPLSLLCRLATSGPPPRFHTVKYAGALARTFLTGKRPLLHLRSSVQADEDAFLLPIDEQRVLRVIANAKRAGRRIRKARRKASSGRATERKLRHDAHDCSAEYALQK